MRLHDHPRSSNAQKVRFLLGVLGLEYERRTVPFEVARPDWHLALNPLGGIPALIDGELVLAESNTILRYLAAREGRADLLPGDAAELAHVDWLLDTVAMTLRPACREIDAPAYGFRPRRGIGAEPPRPEDLPAAIARIAPRLERLLAPARRRRLRLPRPPHGGRLRCDALALAPAARGSPPGPRAAPRLGRDGRRATPRGSRSRPRAGCRVITSRANGRVKAARALGEAKERRRTGLFVDEGEDALRSALAAGIAPVEAFVDDDLGSDRIADELSAAGAKVHRCTARSWRRSRRSRHTSRAVGVFRANDLPPLAPARPRARSACSSTASPTPATSARCCAAPRASAPRTSRSPRAAPIRSRRAPCARAWARSTRCR